jgi:hypothetical protein
MVDTAYNRASSKLGLLKLSFLVPALYTRRAETVLAPDNIGCNKKANK